MGVSDLTLLSKISNEAINDNLKKRFENAEIYVRTRSNTVPNKPPRKLMMVPDLYRPCLGLGQSFPGS